MTPTDQLRSALRDLLECVQDASALDLMPDAEPYKAEAVWDDVLYRARLALRTTDPKEP